MTARLSARTTDSAARVDEDGRPGRYGDGVVPLRMVTEGALARGSSRVSSQPARWGPIPLHLTGGTEADRAQTPSFPLSLCLSLVSGCLPPALALALVPRSTSPASGWLTDCACENQASRPDRRRCCPETRDGGLTEDVGEDADAAAADSGTGRGSEAGAGAGDLPVQGGCSCGLRTDLGKAPVEARCTVAGLPNFEVKAQSCSDSYTVCSSNVDVLRCAGSGAAAADNLGASLRVRVPIPSPENSN